MRKRIEEIDTLGAKVLVVTLSQPSILKMYQDSKQFPFSFVADPEKKLYFQYGLNRVSIGRMFHPKVLWHYLSLILRGWLVRPIKKGEDVLQLGGDFIISPERKLVYAYRSVDPSDRPTGKKLVQQLQKLHPANQ